MVYLYEELYEELCRYVDEYRWNFSLISHIFRVKHNKELSVKELEKLYCEAKSREKAK